MEKIILSYQESGLERAQPLRRGPRPPANISGFLTAETNTISAQMTWKRCRRWYPCRTECPVIPSTLGIQNSFRTKLVNNFVECDNFFFRSPEREMEPKGCNLVTSFLPAWAVFGALINKSWYLLSQIRLIEDILLTKIWTKILQS